jgi:1D-myo-inositol 3-kinase
LLEPLVTLPPAIDYLAVGHVTADVLSDGRRMLGGAVTYAALAAVALGRRPGIVTRADPAFVQAELLPGVAVHVVPAECTTTFVNTYDDAGQRTQRMLAVAPDVAGSDIPAAWRDVGIVHVGTVAHEVGPGVLDGLRAGFVGLAPQGWFRHVGPDAVVRHGPWQAPDGLLERATVVMLSEEDLAGDPRGVAWFAQRSPALVVTDGPKGARAFVDRGELYQPALPARVVDPTGAGDTFAAAFFIRLVECGDVARALRFAAAAAAFKVEHLGPGGLPGRAAVAARAGPGA